MSIIKRLIEMELDGNSIAKYAITAGRYQPKPKKDKNNVTIRLNKKTVH